MNLASLIKRAVIFNPPTVTEEFSIQKKPDNIKYDVRTDGLQAKPEYKISKRLEENLKYIQKRFSYPDNNDFVIRKITLRGEKKAFVIFYDGMADGDSINTSIIGTLLELPLLTGDKLTKSEDTIIESFVAHCQADKSDDIEAIIEEVNFGSCALFVDGIDKGFILDVRSWGHRGIDKPENEQSIYGPQEAFAEMLRNNSALVRKIIKTERLVAYGVKIGRVSKTRGVLMYISDIANEELVAEMKRKLEAISVDYVISSEEVGHFIGDNKFLLTNQTLTTERPDRVARALTEGRVALLMNGSPRALIFPTNAFELLHAPSDAYISPPYANMSRIIRITGILISVLLPALYLAVILFHQEIIPTFLLYAISASRENVPFPSLAELLLMNLAFELIREAGLRMPSPIGSTLGIVGGLILGQAAVSAKIVSPLMIIIIAVTGIGSFAAPDYSLEWSYRLLRLIFIILAAGFGFYGIALGVFLYAMLVGAKENNGIPFIAPINNGGKEFKHSLFVSPIWKKEKRADFLATKNPISEPPISRKWHVRRNKRGD